MKHAQSWVLSFLLLSSASAWERPANAEDNASPGDEARARELAAEAWRLSEAKRPVEACSTYRKALALKRSPGLLNNVGRCFEQEGDAVSAIETFESSVELAEQLEPSPQRQAWLEYARQEIGLLEPQLGKLVFHLPLTQGLALSLDRRQLAADSQHLYVKPGRHQLEASAAGYVPHSAELVPKAGEPLQVEVPALVPVAASAPPAAPAPLPEPRLEKPSDSPSASRVLPWVLLGIGGVTAISATPFVSDESDSSSLPLVLALGGLGIMTVGAIWTMASINDSAQGPAPLNVACAGDGCALLVQGRF